MVAFCGCACQVWILATQLVEFCCFRMIVCFVGGFEFGLLAGLCFAWVVMRFGSCALVIRWLWSARFCDCALRCLFMFGVGLSSGLLG